MISGIAVLVVATLDTKGREAAFMKVHLEKLDIPVVLMDVGILNKPLVKADIPREEVALAGGRKLSDILAIKNEGEALAAMIEGSVALANQLFQDSNIGGVLSLGGSMGTTLGTAVMRKLPIGVPKVMVSTMASINTRAFVGTSDILMLHSVCDLSGLNRITKKVLHNAAAAMCGMIKQPVQGTDNLKPVVFISTLGTTEACTQHIRQALDKSDYEVIVFHTLGSGGYAMEEMIEKESPAAVVDLSLHELAHNRFGGNYDAGVHWGTTAVKNSIPAVFVPGNIDFLVYGPLSETLEKIKDRPYHRHNKAITVVRKTASEMEILAPVLTQNCNEAAILDDRKNFIDLF